MYSNALERTSTLLIVAGFSFADEHLANITKRAANANPTLQIVVFAYDRSAKEIIQNSATSKNIDDIDEVSEKIGVGAILYSFLKNGREKDIVFTWKDILDFEGESGPYVQYAYARGKSVIRKAAEMGIDYSGADLSLLEGSDEFELVKQINSFYDAVKEAANKILNS